MAKFIKQALHVGQHFESDGKKIPVTSARLKHWSEQFGKLTANRYNVPIDWDHGDTLAKISPVLMSEQKKRRSAKNTVGELSAFKLAKDGQSAEIVLEVSDPKAAGRAKRNEVYISPVILESWKDGHGNEYKDVITHVDFVNHPVDHSQGPFKEVPAAKEAGSVAMAIRMGLSAPSAILMGDGPDDDKSDDGDDSDEGETDTEIDGDGDGEGEESKAEINSPERVSRVIEALKAHDLVLPEDTDATNILERLEVALGVKAAIEGKGPEGDPNNPAAGGNSQVKVTDPGGFQGMSLPNSVKASIAYAERQHRKTVEDRLQAALESGRCTPAEHAERTKGLGVVKLSLDDAGKPELSDLEKWIESREAVPAGTFWSEQVRSQKMSLTEVKPHLGGGEPSAEESKKIAAWALGGEYPK